MDWFLYDSGLRHERVKLMISLNPVTLLSLFQQERKILKILLTQ